MFSIDSHNRIALPQGDSISFDVIMTENGEPAQFDENTVAVFGFCTSKYKWVFSKVFPVTGNTVKVYLSNADTRSVKIGDYLWDVRIVTNPEYDADGNVICQDESDNVISLFSGEDELPEFSLTGVSANV